MGLEDVASLCRKRAQSAEEDVRTPSDASAQTDVGFVYLIRSGRHYKIGKSNAAGRRERSLPFSFPRKQPRSTSSDHDPRG